MMTLWQDILSALLATRKKNLSLESPHEDTIMPIFDIFFEQAII